MISSLIFIVWAAFLNKVRGGLLNHIWNKHQFWKIVATLNMMVAMHYCLGLPPLDALIIAVGWYAFLFYEWGAWFDIAQLDPQYERGGIFRPIYRWFGSRYGQRTTDQVLMFLRGNMSVVLFAAIAYVTGNVYVLFLTPLLSAFWTLAYVVDRAWFTKFYNFAEYYAGAIIAIFIIFALKF